jgi:hypothetical protein
MAADRVAEEEVGFALVLEGIAQVGPTDGVTAQGLVERRLLGLVVDVTDQLLDLTVEPFDVTQATSGRPVAASAGGAASGWSRAAGAEESGRASSAGSKAGTHLSHRQARAFACQQRQRPRNS